MFFKKEVLVVEDKHKVDPFHKINADLDIIKGMLRQLGMNYHPGQKLKDLEEKIDDNMKRLNSMMNEFKGLIAQVRSKAASNDWYKQEFKATPSNVTTVILDDAGKQEIRTTSGITFKEI